MKQKPVLTSQIARRLEKLRNRHRDLWADDTDDEPMQLRSSNSRRKGKVSTVLSESEEEEVEARRSRHHQRREKSVRHATCLICSVLSQLSSHNCCSKHLAALQERRAPPSALPDQVMIIPLTDELIQRYLNPEQIHQLRRTSTSRRKVKSLKRALS